MLLKIGSILDLETLGITPFPKGITYKVLLANIHHIYDADWAQATVNKVFDYLKPGSRIGIHVFCADKTSTGPLEDVIFRLNIGLLTKPVTLIPLKKNLVVGIK
jgi:hypothetical protein